MKAVKLWGSVAALAVLLAPGAAQAQTLFNVRNPFQAGPLESATTTDKKDGRFRRWNIGLGAAAWQFPDQAQLITGPGGTATFKSSPRTAGSLLVSADYFLTRRVSVGMWYNPRVTKIMVEDPNNLLGFGRDEITNSIVHTHAADAHVTYYLPGKWFRGMSVQGGYAYEHNTVFKRNGFFSGFLGTQFEFARESFNVWLNKSQQITKIRIDGKERPISLFGSAGYYFSEYGETKASTTGFIGDLQDGDGAFHLLGGVSVGFSEALSLSASYWHFDLGGANSSRISAGLTWAL
jgi:hypothetical protein